MKLYLARHAITKENIKKISSGQTNGKLAKKGKEQSKKLAKRLEKEKIDIIYCSDLGRCKDTLKPFLKLKKVPVIYKKELRERNDGIFQEKPHKEMIDWFEEQKKKYPSKNKFKFKLPKGESFNELQKRIEKFIDKLMKKEKGKKVLIMSHGRPLIAIKLHLFKKNPETHYNKYNMSNAALSTILIKDKENHTLRLLNSTKHLK